MQTHITLFGYIYSTFADLDLSVAIYNNYVSPYLRVVCVYLVLQLIIGIIIENIETLEKIENMKISQKHVQV
jgi:hypothetical protein